MKSKMIKKADLILVVTVLMVSFLFLLLRNTGDSNPVATVTVDGTVVDTIELANIQENQVKSYLDGAVKLQVSKNEIQFHYSNCKSKTCVKTGVLRKNGDTAVCLPNKVLVCVKADGEKSQFQTF